MEDDYIDGLEPSTEIPSDLEASSEPSQSESKPEPAIEAAPKQQEPSFDERLDKHPRFKEIIEQKNQYAKQAKDLEARYTQLEQKLQQISSAPKGPSEQEEFAKALEGVDPRFAKAFRDSMVATQRSQQLEATVQQLQQEYANSRVEQERQVAVNEVLKLHDENKVAPELRELYNNQLDSMARSGQFKTVKDVVDAYKGIHASYTKLLDGVRKSERESYVAGKKSDAAIPSSQPKGPASPSSPKQKPFAYSKDPEEARAQMVQRVIKSSREGSKL